VGVDYGEAAAVGFILFQFVFVLPPRRRRFV
jgi:hypothetical protein